MVHILGRVLTRSLRLKRDRVAERAAATAKVHLLKSVQAIDVFPKVAETLAASAKINVYLAVQIYHRLLGSDAFAS